MRLQRMDEAGWLAGLLETRTRVVLPQDVVLGRYALERWRIPPRVLRDHVLFWLAQGAIEGRVGGNALPGSAGRPGQAGRWEAGTLLWLAPGVPHQFTMATGTRRIVIYNLRFQVLRNGVGLRLKPDLLEAARTVDLEALFASVQDEAQAPGGHGEALLRGLIAQVAVRIFRAVAAARAPAGGARVLSRFQRDRLGRFAEEAAAERPSPADLAREISLSPDYFARVFRQSYGVSPKRWLVQQRIRLAAVQLTQSNRNVSEVARALGYGDLFLFSRQFKSVMGVSPRAYRQRTGQGE